MTVDTSATDLNFWRQGLAHLPSEIFSRTDLEVLNASENKLTSLPEAIGNLTKLHTLDLARDPELAKGSGVRNRLRCRYA